MESQENIENLDNMDNPDNIKKNDIGVLMVGLNEAGKTALLYKLILGEDMKTIPTIGYNVETVELANTNFTIWDIGGLKNVRVLWTFYSNEKSAVIFVIDASNPERFEEAKEYLHAVMSSDDLCNAVLLIVSNKQDKLNNSSNVLDLEESLDLKSLKQSYRICNTCAIGNWSLDGIVQNLSELIKTLE